MRCDDILMLFRKEGVFVPGILLKYYKQLKLTEKELLFLSYLFGSEDLVAFNILKYSQDLGVGSNEIMEILSSLCDKKIINMVVKKDSIDIMREYLDISFLYDKLRNLLLLDEENKDLKGEEVNIYSIIEKEFGRTLSPIEYETIKHWLDAKIDENLIKEALKEAVLNGVNNLKYIDKILFEWNKKGYKKPQDIKRKNRDEEPIKLFEYDWLKDNE